MKYAADFRQMAKEALNGKWKTAVWVGFLAYLMGGQIAGGIGSSGSGSSSNNSNLYNDLMNTQQGKLILKILAVVAIIAVVRGLIHIVIGGATKLGYAIFNLKLVDGQEATVQDLFSQFNRLGDGFGMIFGMWLYVFLWSMLFVIPGIIKSYSYAMTPYILAENPGMKADDAITESRKIMDGNKWRLFCLLFSFIGWEILCIIPSVAALMLRLDSVKVTVVWCALAGGFGATLVGALFLAPYKEAALAAFYRDVSLYGAPANKEDYEILPPIRRI